MLALSVGVLSLLGIGTLWYLFDQEYIVICMPAFHRERSTHTVPVITKDVISVFFPKESSLTQEERTLIHPDNHTTWLGYIVEQWVQTCDEEGLFTRRPTVQSVSCSSRGTDVIISFDRAPYTKHGSTHAAWIMIESLLATLRPHVAQNARVYICTHHTPLTDVHLDFEQPWPIEGFMSTYAREAHQSHIRNIPYKPCCIVLDPAGDARIPGRPIENTLERSVTYAFAEALKQYIEDQSDHVHVFFTRSLGESVSHDQRITCAHRKQADVYLSLHAYHNPHGVVIDWARYATQSGSIQKLSHRRWLSARTVHLTLASLMENMDETYAVLETMCARYAAVCGIHRLPLKPLARCAVPAYFCEIGIHEASAWKALVEPIGSYILHVAASLQSIADHTNTNVD